MRDGPLTPDPAPLNGWKEIASYLGRSVRAVQRWERELGLPVHRIRTASGQTVYAFRAEIDAWRREMDARNAALPHDGEAGDEASAVDDRPAEAVPAAPPHAATASDVPRRARRPWFALAWMGAGMALAGILGAVLSSERLAPAGDAPASFLWSGTTAQAVDAQGRALWSFDFHEPVRQARDARQAVGDIDGDGTVEVFVPVEFAPPGEYRSAGSPHSDAVYVFDLSGRLKWSVSTDASITCGGRTFSGPWQAKALLVSSSRHRLWIAFTHHTWRPSFVLEVTPDHHSSIRYFQAGWILSLADWTTSSGRYLVAGGVLNEYARASVVLMNDSVPFAKAPSDSADNDCGVGSTQGVSRVYLLPHLETTVPPDAYELVNGVDVYGPDVKVSYDWAHAVVRLTSDLTMKDFAVTDAFFVKHRILETQGVLTHSAENCPFPAAPEEVPTWMPTAGWTTEVVPPLPNAPATPPHND